MAASCLGATPRSQPDFTQEDQPYTTSQDVTRHSGSVLSVPSMLTACVQTGTLEQ